MNNVSPTNYTHTQFDIGFMVAHQQQHHHYYGDGPSAIDYCIWRIPGTLLQIAIQHEYEIISIFSCWNVVCVSLWIPSSGAAAAINWSELFDLIISSCVGSADKVEFQWLMICEPFMLLTFLCDIKQIRCRAKAPAFFSIKMNGKMAIHLLRGAMQWPLINSRFRFNVKLTMKNHLSTPTVCTLCMCAGAELWWW